MMLARRARRRVLLRRAHSLTKLILEKLAELGQGTLDAFFPAKYPEARMWRALLGLDPRYEFSPRTFSAILSRLRTQGLVARQGTSRKTRWALTPAGRAALNREESDSQKYAGLPPPDRTPRLVIFDIPERERAKRDAIRRELVACDYRPLQKSVWLGYRPLPEDFLELLDALNLRRYLHLVTIRDLGTVDGEVR